MTSLYDEVPYPILTHGHTHPDRLAVAASLLGLDPAPVATCQVLELGCGSGGNLIAMAETLPGASFVGIDYSAPQVAEGVALIEAVGLANVTLRQADIASLPYDLQEFDYIIVHGVFSWVPALVRDAILRVIRTHLAANGVAYVSYNTYPGWHSLMAVRGMMLYAVRDEPEPVARAAKARELVQFLARSADNDAGAFASFIHAYHVALIDRGDLPQSDVDASLLHDELADVNDPLYFHEFVSLANEHGLQYMAEADLAGATSQGISPEVVQGLGSFAGSLIEAEQYLDFLRNQTFRRTLICHQEAEITRRLPPGRNPLLTMHVASSARPKTPNRDYGDGEVVRFEALDGKLFSTDHALTRACVAELRSVYPRAVAFPDLAERGLRLLYRDGSGPERPDREITMLAANLLKAMAFGRSLVELYTAPVALAGRPGVRPEAGAVARELARRGRELLPNFRHERVRPDAFTMGLLPHFDGRNRMEDLVRIAGAALPPGAAVPPSQIEARVRSALRWLARASMLRAS